MYINMLLTTGRMKKSSGVVEVNILPSPSDIHFNTAERLPNILYCQQTYNTEEHVLQYKFVKLWAPVLHILIVVFLSSSSSSSTSIFSTDVGVSLWFSTSEKKIQQILIIKYFYRNILLVHFVHVYHHCFQKHQL